MNKNLQAGLGVLLALMGVIFTLQGLNILKGSSVMSGKPLWAIVGPIVALAGLALILRRPRVKS